MDLEKDWELIPDEGFLEINDDGAGKKIYSRRYHPSIFSAGTTAIFQMNDYFICPSSNSQYVQVPRQQQLLPVPIHSEPQQDPRDQIVKSSDEVLAAADHHHQQQQQQDPAAVSQVFFKKTTKEITESVDTIKVSSSWTNVAHEIEGGGAAGANNLRFGEKATEDPHQLVGSDDGQGEGEAPLINSIWKWSLTGVGAICSFGVAAAATLFVIVLTSSGKSNSSHRQNLQFQIYTNKGMKEVGRRRHQRHHDTIAAVVRGSSVPITTARITSGGYYDASL